MPHRRGGWNTSQDDAVLQMELAHFFAQPLGGLFELFDDSALLRNVSGLMNSIATSTLIFGSSQDFSIVLIIQRCIQQAG
jgi:hypothetical protein